MVSILNQRQIQLREILGAWNDLEKDMQKKSINLVMSFVESASLISELSNDESLKSELEKFRANYETIYGKNVAQLKSSDFSPEVMQRLNQIHEIDSNQSATLEEKRQQVEGLLGGKEGVQEFRSVLIAQSDHKYQHAHGRISWNYGQFVHTILDNQGKSIAQKAAQLSQIEDEKEFFAALVKLNSEVALADNFDIINKVHGVDGIEEHTAINQGTLYRAGLDVSRQIKELEEFVVNGSQISASSSESTLKDKAAAFFTEISALKSIKVNSVQLAEEVKKSKDLDLWQQEYTDEIKTKGAALTVGYEMEFLLLPFGGPDAEDRRQRADFEKLVKGSADLSSRKKMRDNYAFPSDNIAHTPNVSLLFSNDELRQESEINKINDGEKEGLRDQIKSFLEAQKNENNAAMIVQAQSNIDLLSREEIYFLDLLFLKHEQAQHHKLALDGVFEWDKSLEENLANILPNIANKASFYPQTLDMIRAHEVAIGPFEIDDLAAKDASIAYMRGVSAEHQLRLKDRDVQINIGARMNGENLLKIESEEVESEKRVFVTGSSLEIMTAIQNGLTKAIEENPWIARGGQEFVSVGVDRKKAFDGYLKGTPYYKQYNPEVHLEDASAFPVHRDNTGKSGMVRLARINPDLAVLELRLIGNNTHVPHHDESVKPVFNGIDKLPEIVFPYIIESLREANLEQNSAKVAVNYDGSISDLPRREIKYNPSSEVEPSKILKLKPYAKEAEASL